MDVDALYCASKIRPQFIGVEYFVGVALSSNRLSSQISLIALHSPRYGHLSSHGYDLKKSLSGRSLKTPFLGHTSTLPSCRDV